MEKGCGCEIEIGHCRKKIYVKVCFDPEEIWIDTKGLPRSAFLCAMIDAIPVLVSKVGESRKSERTFVNIEWAINEWGGDEKIVEALKKRKQMILDDLPRLKQK